MLMIMFSCPLGYASPTSSSDSPERQRVSVQQVKGRSSMVTPPQSRSTMITESLVLKVLNSERAQARIDELLQKFQAFIEQKNSNHVRLRVIPQELTLLTDSIAELGIVFDRSLSRKDLTEQIALLQATIRSKSEIFQRTRELLDQADTQVTLQIEGQMTALITEIERAKGRLRVLLDQARLARLQIAFKIAPTRAQKSRASPIPWLNRIGVGQMERRFEP